ncbi:ribonuclease HII [Thermostichus vulcanus]|uniref:Ribonuclease HII n=1 Tax=Thermostichus vulcanus str. 'Rupite' TaxID=2813851 RepID=A0ABT0C8T5_THEVL|nr:ribonuclease HII [Thermostichus vulcanus]MCJ2542179.1 ribonuclease HII [Thermostichus vulcanus str. 'Rupite']
MGEQVQPSLVQEGSLWQQGIHSVAGVDEVGRGSLAGPVVAAAVILPVEMDPAELEGVKDSKQLRPQQRTRLAEQIRQVALAVGIGSASAAEIDQLNIRQATVLAMQRALAEVGEVEHILLDGLPLAELGSQQTALVKGDQISLSIAAASIVAKVWRDTLMQDWDRQYPGYGWRTNVGYGTRAHRRALQELGLTPQHRRSFVHLADPKAN